MSKIKKHINIPVFIPHLGCPNNCVFCNQRAISGKKEFFADSVIAEIEEVLSTIKEKIECEIAFFGGSFTGIDRELMVSLLDIGQSYVDKNRVSSMRLSTRPDYINDEILEILSSYSVKTIELGIQSMDDSVLLASKRGHTAAQTEQACEKIKKAGFDLVGQMMVGLPGSNMENEKNTAEKICKMGADGTRVYPTVVFYDTELCEMARNGDYIPLDEHNAIIRTKEVLKIFDKYRVPCIRVGLCASENLSSDEAVYGGANQSAIGEMAIGEIFFEKMDEQLSKLSTDEMADLKKNAIVYVPSGCQSKAIGQKKKNVIRLCTKYSLSSLKILEKNSLIGYNISIS